MNSTDANVIRNVGHCDKQTAKIGSLVDVQDSQDPEGLRVMYYLVQDLKVSSLQIGRAHV